MINPDRINEAILKAKIVGRAEGREEMREFVRDCRDNWECDTTGYQEFETHRPAQCRRCQAEKLIPKEGK